MVATLPLKCNCIVDVTSDVSLIPFKVLTSNILLYIVVKSIPKSIKSAMVFNVLGVVLENLNPPVSEAIDVYRHSAVFLDILNLKCLYIPYNISPTLEANSSTMFISPNFVFVI